MTLVKSRDGGFRGSAEVECKEFVGGGRVLVRVGVEEGRGSVCEELLVYEGSDYLE